MSTFVRIASQVFRRALQLSVILFVVYTAFGGLWRNYKVAHNSSRLVGLMEGKGWGASYAANEKLLSAWGESYEASLDFVGMPWASTTFGVPSVDPWMFITQLLSQGGVPGSLWVAVLIPVLLAVLLGKVFCSHLCPMRLVFDIGQSIRAGLLWFGIELPQFRSNMRLGGFVALGGLLGASVGGAAVWVVLLPYVSLSAGIFLSVTAGTTGGLFGIVLFWVMFDMLLAPGLFCHNLCPTGFLLEQLGRFAPFSLLKRGKNPCPGKCQTCKLVCPFGLFPGKETHRPACNNCGQCISRCPEKKLRRGFSLPIIMGSLFMVLLPQQADAHHNKGLPHYGYYENYPQVPFEENVAVDGRWELGATIFNFQGLDRRTADTPNDVKFFVYLYDLELDKNYEGAALFEIVRDDTEVVASFRREKVDEELVYSTRETLPATGDYHLRMTFELDRDAHVVELPFYVELDQDTVSWGLIATIVGPLLPIFVLVFLGRTRRGRNRLLGERVEQNTPTEETTP